MKATYLKPETKTHKIHADRHLMVGSDIAVGQAYGTNDQTDVLSRGDDSVWDDEENY